MKEISDIWYTCFQISAKKGVLVAETSVFPCDEPTLRGICTHIVVLTGAINECIKVMKCLISRK